MKNLSSDIIRVADGASAYSGGGGTATITEIEIDFGTTGRSVKTFVITDLNVSPTSKIIIQQSGKAPTGKSADENEMDKIQFNATPGTGQFILNAECLTGRVLGKFKVNYILG